MIQWYRVMLPPDLPYYASPQTMMLTMPPEQWMDVEAEGVEIIDGALVFARKGADGFAEVCYILAPGTWRRCCPRATVDAQLEQARAHA